jgi:hypothetical protein
MFIILVRNSSYTSLVPGEQQTSFQLLTPWQYMQPVVLLDVVMNMKLYLLIGHKRERQVYKVCRNLNIEA